MDRKEQALKLHEHGYNCAQSVACTYCNVMGADPETVFKLAEPFGFGLGTMETCGAVSAMALVVGMKMSDGNLEQPKTKRYVYKRQSMRFTCQRTFNQHPAPRPFRRRGRFLILSAVQTRKHVSGSIGRRDQRRRL